MIRRTRTDLAPAMLMDQGLDWPLKKERRRHIHGTVGAHDLPVSHARGDGLAIQIGHADTDATEEG